MNRHFKQHQFATDGIIDLLVSTTLGTNGAQYRLLNTRERIQALGACKHLTLERNERVLANISFCIRNQQHYLRYFAFDARFQSSNPRNSRKTGLLKSMLHQYFEQELDADTEGFYAYVDPKNDRSAQMIEQFGFSPSVQITTQTFSRLIPKKHPRHKVLKLGQLPKAYLTHLSKQRNYFNDYQHLGSHHALFDEKGELLCIAHADQAAWELKRLPGKYGGFLTKVIPYIPVINQFIRPKRHAFVFVDGVYNPSGNAQDLAQLYGSILHHYQLKTLNWWVDSTSPTYTAVQHHIKWGIMDRLIGRPQVQLCTKGKPETGTEHYVSGYDLT